MLKETWWISKSLCWVKKARHKRVWFHIYEAQEQAKLIYHDRGQTSGDHRVWVTRREQEGASWDARNVDILSRMVPPDICALCLRCVPLRKCQSFPNLKRKLLNCHCKLSCKVMSKSDNAQCPVMPPDSARPGTGSLLGPCPAQLFVSRLHVAAPRLLARGGNYCPTLAQVKQPLKLAGSPVF